MNAKIEAAPWEVLPPTQALPKADREEYLEMNGRRLWYAHYGEKNVGVPVLLLHGGFASSECYSASIPTLVDAGYHVIALDSSGHGRSRHDGTALTYSRMAEDVISVLDANGIEKVDVVGWSDGGCIGYDLAIRFRSRIARLFAFGANMNHSCYPGDIEQVIAQPAFSEYLTRSSRAYEMFIPDSIERERAMGSINEMWSKEPNFDPKEMETITTPTTICLGQYDEAITIEHAAGISKLIQNSNIVILPNVSHFGLIQNPELFSEAVLSFLKWR